MSHGINRALRTAPGAILARVVAAWQSLPPAAKRIILATVEAHADPS